MDVTEYELKLYINGTLIGDVRPLAQDLEWIRRRTKIGADQISFTLNDKLFADWCIERNTTINDVLKPLALECQVVRNGTPLVAGFLATMPAYSPKNYSADLSMQFDGYLNLLNGVYIYNSTTKLPLGTVTGTLNNVINNLVTMANTRSSAAGKGYNFSYYGGTSSFPTITNTFDNYKTVKEFICERSDNTTGAGPFDVYFLPNVGIKYYEIWSQAQFGETINDWVARYPADIDAVSATSISANEVSGFASSVIAIGSGDVSSSAAQNTAIKSFAQNNSKVAEYGYYETLIQESSITQQTTLTQKANTELAVKSKIIWQPEITLTGRMVAPKPSGAKKIWIGDIITIDNTEDLTGQTNGQFRVNELNVKVSSSNGETITPVLERI